MSRLKSREVDRQAAEWAAKLDSGPLRPDEQAALDAWLGADTRHLGAFAKARAVLAFTDRAKAFGPEFDPASFEPVMQADSSSISWLSRRRFALAGGIAATAGAMFVVIPPVWRALRARSYETRIGETRIVPLDDGSVVTLNTDSKIEVGYTDERRGITLVKGEALFDVAKNKLRPFIVDAGGATVRAVGTSFSVTLLPNRPLHVLVREGEVELKRPEIGEGAPVRLTANHMAVAHRDEPVETIPMARLEVTRELSWRVGRLTFEGESLEAAAATFARYSSIHIQIDDPALAKESVTGVFVSNDPIGFSKAVALSLGLRAEVKDDAVKLSR
jgi:transmembrane sensor